MHPRPGMATGCGPDWKSSCFHWCAFRQEMERLLTTQPKNHVTAIELCLNVFLWADSFGILRGERSESIGARKQWQQKPAPHESGPEKPKSFVGSEIPGDTL
jgi:hypothetical protein